MGRLAEDFQLIAELCYFPAKIFLKHESPVHYASILKFPSNYKKLQTYAEARPGIHYLGWTRVLKVTYQ